MRKIIVFNWVSLDGYIAGSNDETVWFAWDKGIEAYYKHIQRRVDTILYGRKTYETMAAYWPTEASAGEDPEIRNHMNNTSKIVFSKSLKKAHWNRTSLFPSIDSNEIAALKHLPGKDIIIFGSSTVISVLQENQLIDEYMLMVNPVVLGSGTPLFQNMKNGFKLKNIDSKRFNSGAILLHYQMLVEESDQKTGTKAKSD